MRVSKSSLVHFYLINLSQRRKANPNQFRITSDSHLKIALFEDRSILVRLSSIACPLRTHLNALSDICFKKRVAKGGGGFQSHIKLNFSIKSRITGNFLTNHASRKKE